MILQFGLQIILPVVLLYGLWRGMFGSRAEWLLNVAAVGAGLAFVFLTARWDFTSYYLRIVLPLLLAAAAAMSYRRISRGPGERQRPKLPATLTNLVVLLAFVYLCVIVIWGYHAPTSALKLAYPLRDGTYYVGGGGNCRLINNHQAHASQKFALDIVRLNVLGNRASGLAPADLQRYAIFGDTVYSPCAGTVIRAVDELPDHRPPAKDIVNVAGNHVLIESDGVKVILAHLKQGSITVAAGMRVEVGDVLGQVGNSGNSSQPHLHLHAERGGEPEEILTGAGVPIELGGRFLVRNSLFTGGDE